MTSPSARFRRPRGRTGRVPDDLDAAEEFRMLEDEEQRLLMKLEEVSAAVEAVRNDKEKEVR